MFLNTMIYNVLSSFQHVLNQWQQICQLLLILFHLEVGDTKGGKIVFVCFGKTDGVAPENTYHYIMVEQSFVKK